MSNPKNPILGHWTCERSKKENNAEVYQTTKRGRHLYTRCECCGLIQGTGAERQQQIWDEMKPLPGATVVKPSNVTDDPKRTPVNEPALEHQKPSEPESEPESDTLGDFDPTESEPESETEAEPAGRSLNKKALISGAVLLLAAGAGAWLN